MADHSPSLGLLAFLIAVVLVSGGVGTYYLYQHNYPKPAAGQPVVLVGDNVTVNYIGMFGSGGEVGRVFDTSLHSVALNNITYPKSLQYSGRNASGYSPLGVHVGPRTPSSGYTIGNVTFVGVVPGFWRGLVGLPVNQTRLISMPPALGYGPTNPSCLRTVPLVQTLSSTVILSPSDFAKLYAGVFPFSGVSFVDPTYGWTDTVLSSNNSSVVVGLLPAVGTTTTYPGWTVEVTAVAGGTITLQNLLTPANAGRVAGKLFGATVCGTTQFIVTSVNPNGTFTEDFDREVVGQTLLFQVTVVQIVSGPTSSSSGGGGY